MLTGGQAMMATGDQSESNRAAPEPPLPSITPVQAVKAAMSPTDQAEAAAAAAKLAAQEEEDLQALKRRIDRASREAGLGTKVSTTVSRRGLEVRLLTDKLFFDSGSAVIKAPGVPLLDKIGAIVADERDHPVEVEGHTDDRPIATSQFPSNWQLSGARAGAVVQRLIGAGVAGKPGVARRLRGAPAGRVERARARPGTQPPGRDHPRPVCMEQRRRKEATTHEQEDHHIAWWRSSSSAAPTSSSSPSRRRPPRSRTSRARSTCSRRSSWSTSPTAATRRCRRRWS